MAFFMALVRGNPHPTDNGAAATLSFGTQFAYSGHTSGFVAIFGSHRATEKTTNSPALLLTTTSNSQFRLGFYLFFWAKCNFDLR